MTTLEGYVTLTIFTRVRLADAGARNNTAKALVSRFAVMDAAEILLSG
jgi:hypothetical protein